MFTVILSNYKLLLGKWMHISWCAVVLFFISKKEVYGQEANRDSIERWENIVANSTDDVSVYNALIDLHNATFKAEPELSRRYVYSMLSLSKKMNDTARILKSFEGLRRCYIKVRNYDSVFFYDRCIYQLTKATNDPNLFYKAHVNIAIDFMDSEKHMDSVTVFLNKALVLATKNKSTSQDAEVNKLLGYYYSGINKNTKAIPYFEKAVKYYEQLNDEKNLFKTKLPLAEAMMEVNPTKQTLKHLIDILEYYEKTSSKYSQAYSRVLLGNYFSFSSERNKAIENYKFAQQLYKEDNNHTDFALAGIEIAKELMYQKRYDEALKYIKEAKELLVKANFDLGITTANLAYAQYYSATEKYNKATTLFGYVYLHANTKDTKSILPQYRQELAKHYHQLTKYRERDSVLFLFYKNLLQESEPPSAAKTIRYFLNTTNGLDTNGYYILEAIHSPIAFESLKNYFSKSSFHGYVLPDSFKTNAAISLIKNDSTDEGVLTELEVADAIMNKRLVEQNLALEEKNHRITKAVGIIGLIVALIIISLLTVLIRSTLKNKKRIEQEKLRAERDKETIESLQSHIHHLVENNLKKVKILIEDARKETNPNQAFENLTTRVNTIIKAHSFLKEKSDDTLVDGVMINIGEYIKGSWDSLQMIFGVEEDIMLHLNTNDIKLEGKDAVNLCMLATELLTNTCKYAFDPNDERDDKKITIAVNFNGHNRVTMLYKDNGKGLPKDYISGTGMNLIKQMAQSLRANYHIQNEEGFKLDLSFYPDATSKATI